MDSDLSTATGQGQNIDELLTSTNKSLHGLLELIEKTETHLNLPRADSLMPHPEILDGTEPNMHFKQWRIKMRKKLYHRGVALYRHARQEHLQVDYVLSRLSGCAFRIAYYGASSLVEEGEEQKLFSVNEVMEELERHFSSGRVERIATQEQMFGQTAN